MRVLADENIPLPSIRLLRGAGHDVASVMEEIPGAADTAVLQYAASTARVLLTFDRDYGDLIYRRGKTAPPAVVYLRVVPSTPQEVAVVVEELLRAEVTLMGHFTVVESNRVPAPTPVTGRCPKKPSSSPVPTVRERRRSRRRTWTNTRVSSSAPTPSPNG